MVTEDSAPVMMVKERLTCATLEVLEANLLILPKREPFTVLVNSWSGSPLLQE